MKGDDMKGLKSRKEILKRMEYWIALIRDNGLLTEGYMAGMVNGLRLIQAEIKGEDPIFERSEVLPKAKSFSKQDSWIWFLGQWKEKNEYRKSKNTERNKKTH